MSNFSRQILRFSLAMLFLWFGWQQLSSPEAWVFFLPDYVAYFPIPGEMLVQLNGWLEIIAALFLIAGVYTKVIAGLLGLHLLGIALMVGGATGVRDAALAFANFALAFSEPDNWTLDKRSKS